MCQPLLSSKSNSGVGRILLIENNDILSDDKSIATVFNEYFNCITDNLDLEKWDTCTSSLFNDPVSQEVRKYYNHPSIQKIKAKFNNSNKFEFMPTDENTIYKLIMQLNSSKKTGGDIPTKILKEAAVICSPLTTSCVNSALSTGKFPNELKLADIIPIHKKGKSTLKENYRPISLLPSISKIFEKVIYSQLNNFLESKFSSLLCGFRKGHSTQHALFNLLQKWQISLDNSEIIGTILSKAYDCLPHELLIAKLEAYGLCSTSLKLILDCLSNRKHRVKLGNITSSWLELLLGVPQGSILGPLLFNIFIKDIFLFLEQTNICNFADDNTIYACDTAVETVISRLEYDMTKIMY